MSEIFSSSYSFLESAVRLSIPLWFAAYGGMLSERSGIPNIALESFLLTGAFAAAATASLCLNPWFGLVAALIAGLVVAGLFASVVVLGRGHSIVVGTAWNLLIMGLTPLLCKAIFGMSASTPSLALNLRLPTWIFLSILILIALGVFLFLFKTSLGLRLRASGENPEATESLGVSVKKVRFWAVSFSGIIASLGGAYLSTSHGSQFVRGMTAGRGFIALAALILGNWKPLPVFFTCLLFGIADASQILLQGMQFSDGSTVPVQWIQMFPYVITLIVLIAWIGKMEAPQALGSSDSKVG